MNKLNKKLFEELKKLEEEPRAKLFALRFQFATGNLEKSHRIKELKVQIARILTILSDCKNFYKNKTENNKFDLSEKYLKIEKKIQSFIKQYKLKINDIIDKQKNTKDIFSNLGKLPLKNVIDLTPIESDEIVKKEEKKIFNKKKKFIKRKNLLKIKKKTEILK